MTAYFPWSWDLETSVSIFNWHMESQVNLSKVLMQEITWKKFIFNHRNSIWQLCHLTVLSVAVLVVVFPNHLHGIVDVANWCFFHTIISKWCRKATMELSWLNDQVIWWFSMARHSYTITQHYFCHLTHFPWYLSLILFPLLCLLTHFLQRGLHRRSRS